MRGISSGVLVVAAFLLTSAGTATAGMREPRVSVPYRPSDGRVRVIEACRARPGPSGLPELLFWLFAGSDPDPAAKRAIGGVDCGGEIHPWYRPVRSPATVALVLPGPGPSSATATEVAVSASLGDIRRKRLSLLVRPVSPADPTRTIEVLDETERKLTARDANLRVIHAIPSAGAAGVRVGAIGAGCLTPPLSFGANTVLMVPAGAYTLAVFPGTDPECSGEPLPDLTAMPVKLKPRTAYTAIAWVKQGGAVDHFQLRMQRDFCRPGCPIRGTYQDGFHEPRR
jgi:hypothetical protein